MGIGSGSREEVLKSTNYSAKIHQGKYGVGVPPYKGRQTLILSRRVDLYIKTHRHR